MHERTHYLAADNLGLRDRFIAEVGVLPNSQAGGELETWKRTGKVFTVSHNGSEYIPAFQIRDGQPHPTIAMALAVLPADLSDWQRAFWFVGGNGWLNNRVPAELLDDPDALVAAALRAGAEFVG